MKSTCLVCAKSSFHLEYYTNETVLNAGTLDFITSGVYEIRQVACGIVRPYVRLF